MAGEPIGAKRILRIPEEAKSYEQITSIEFIELEAKSGNVRSAAYRPVDGGAQTRIRTGVQDELVDSDLTADEAKQFISKLCDAGVFDWNYSYRPAQGTFVNVAAQWRLKIEFKDKEYRDFVAEGENHFPDNYDVVVDVLMSQDSH